MSFGCPKKFMNVSVLNIHKMLHAPFNFLLGQNKTQQNLLSLHTHLRTEHFTTFVTCNEV